MSLGFIGIRCFLLRGFVVFEDVVGKWEGRTRQGDVFIERGGRRKEDEEEERQEG